MQERRGRPSFSALFELHIIWSEDPEDKPQRIEIHQTINPNTNAPILFPGSPKFKQNLPNKKYLASKK